MITHKFTQAEVHYGLGRPNYRCGVCPNYRIPRSCRMVEGDISPDYVCDKFNEDPYTYGEGE